jgi:DNA mismatch repair ATPase MutS
MMHSYLQKSTSKALVGLTQFSGDDKSRASIANIPKGDSSANATFYFANIVNKMLDSLVVKLRETLNKYTGIVVVNISQLIPEFIYYIRLAEFIEKNIEKGYTFCQPEALEEGTVQMEARDFYNLKLAISDVNMNDIVCNDLDFDPQHSIYILTGANRGGKTTVTQAVGILYVLAQGGIFVPAKSFKYKPVDCIYTHFPADEDKTLDLGRLGEECMRFKEDFNSCTSRSLYLMNESFSTTSFEEGYYIARDSVRALLNKGVRTIYNTHMHKLGYDVDEFNNENPNAKASSLIVKSDNGQRSFKVEVAPPEGMSYARDIAEKYGVTYEKLTGK